MRSDRRAARPCEAAGPKWAGRPMGSGLASGATIGLHWSGPATDADRLTEAEQPASRGVSRRGLHLLLAQRALVSRAEELGCRRLSPDAAYREIQALTGRADRASS